MRTTVRPSGVGRRGGMVGDVGHEFGDWIRNSRAAQGISQRELAERAGISRSYLCDIERGRGKRPSIDRLDDIAKALGADRIELLRVAGILDPIRDPEENARERGLIAVYRALSGANQQAIEAFGRFLLREEQRWVQPRLVNGEIDQDQRRRMTQAGPSLFDQIEQ